MSTQPTYSPDGRHLWDGSQWVAVSKPRAERPVSPLNGALVFVIAVLLTLAGVALFSIVEKAREQDAFKKAIQCSQSAFPALDCPPRTD